MDAPLGGAVGNAVEVMEAISVLQGNGAYDLTAVSIELAEAMLSLAGVGASPCERKRLICQKIDSGEALATLLRMIEEQGGQKKADGTLQLHPGGGVNGVFTAAKPGIDGRMDAEQIGFAALALGAGREKKEDEVDYRCGILFGKKTGERVKKGEIIALLEAASEEKIESCRAILSRAVAISADPPPKPKPHILGRVTAKGKELYV
jgi:thymidine phosphorylase